MLDDPLLTDAETADVARVTKDKLAKLRVTGDGPSFIKIGRAIRYRRSAVEAWLSSLERDRTTGGAGSSVNPGDDPMRLEHRKARSLAGPPIAATPPRRTGDGR